MVARLLPLHPPQPGSALLPKHLSRTPSDFGGSPLRPLSAAPPGKLPSPQVRVEKMGREEPKWDVSSRCASAIAPARAPKGGPPCPPWHGMERPGAGASKHRPPGAFKLQHPVDFPSHASCEFGKSGLVVSGWFVFFPPCTQSLRARDFFFYSCSPTKTPVGSERSLRRVPQILNGGDKKRSMDNIYSMEAAHSGKGRESEFGRGTSRFSLRGWTPCVLKA